MFVIAGDFDLQPYNLPNLDQVESNFQSFIDEREEYELSKAFGVTLWEALKAGMNALPADWAAETAFVIGNLTVYGNKIYKALVDNTNIVPTSDPVTWEEQPDDRWLLLREGGTYKLENDNTTFKWIGMKQLVKPMIYSLWLRYDVDNQVTGIGNVKGKAENSTVVSPNVRICDAWNAYAYNVLNATCWIRPTLGDLYGYLVANESAFLSDVPDYTSMEEYLFEQTITPKRQNPFGL